MDAKLNSSFDANATTHEPGRRVQVRNSRDGDVPAMLAIYLHHIRRGVDPGVDGDFETPDADDLKRRRRSMNNRRMPHLVAEEAGTVVGLHEPTRCRSRKRPAYRYTARRSDLCAQPDLVARGDQARGHGGADGRLRGGGLSPDDRLYRRRPTSPRSSCTKGSASARLATRLRSAINSAAGRTSIMMLRSSRARRDRTADGMNGSAANRHASDAVETSQLARYMNTPIRSSALVARALLTPPSRACV